MNDLFVSFSLSDKCLAVTTTTSLGNMAYQVDEGRGVKEHRKLLAKELGIDINSFTYVHQHHSDILLEVTSRDVGKGRDAFEDGLYCDALYTKEKGVPLCIFHADCVPIFFIDETRNIVGIIHAGFKGTMKHIAYKAIKELIKKEKLDIKNLKFYIGPYRMPQSFIVDDETARLIQMQDFKPTLQNNHFDNGMANKLDLFALGVEEEQIQSANMDTFSDDRFYSAYQKTPVGRLVSLIVLK